MILLASISDVISQAYPYWLVSDVILVSQLSLDAWRLASPRDIASYSTHPLPLATDIFMQM